MLEHPYEVEEHGEEVEELEEVEEEEEVEYNEFFVNWFSCGVSVEWTKSSSVGRRGRRGRRRRDGREFGSASLPVSVKSVFLCSLWGQYRKVL